MGCGACYALCDKNAVTLENIEHIGIRPRFDNHACDACTDCLEICPGYAVNSMRNSYKKTGSVNNNDLFGPTLEIWEGHAADKEIRYRASSGGAVTALALYCLEQENMAFVLHTGMDPKTPWENITVQSKNREELLRHTGSRYNASSPCDSLRLIEASDRPCVFIGKPCDTAAVALLRKKRPLLDKNLGLVLTCFCAGTPSIQGTLDLLKKLDIDRTNLQGLCYRGNGWPGGFSVSNNAGDYKQLLPYRDSWHFLQKYRCMRCHLCPDGLGEIADISCGDAWHIYNKDSNDPGQSLVLVRSDNGRDMLKKAIETEYLKLKPSTAENVIKAQGLVERRKEIFGRQLAIKFLFVPTTRYTGFHLFKCWNMLSIKRRVVTIAGTLIRFLQRGLWHRNFIQ